MDDQIQETQGESKMGKGLLIGIIAAVLLLGGVAYMSSGSSKEEGIAVSGPVKPGIVIEAPTTTVNATGDAITTFAGTVERPELLENKAELVLIPYEYNASVDRASVYAYIAAQGGHRASVDMSTGEWSVNFANLEEGRYKMFLFPGVGADTERVAPVIAGLFDFVESSE